MASNDGRRLTVFGLTFRQHDTRKMHRILDHYESLPRDASASDRAVLYTNLGLLARSVPAHEAASLEAWLLANDGSPFPFERPVRGPVGGQREWGGGVEGGGEGEGEFDAGRSFFEERPLHAAAWNLGGRRLGDAGEADIRGNGNDADPVSDAAQGQEVAIPDDVDPPPQRVPPGPGPRPRYQVRAVPPGRGRGRGFQQVPRGILDPFMGHGPPMVFPQNHTVFDVIGPGRRLGEDGEENALQSTIVDDPEEGELIDPVYQSPEVSDEEFDYDDSDDDDDNDDDDDDEMDDNIEGYDAPARQRYPKGRHPVQHAAADSSSEPIPLPSIECEVCYEDLPSYKFPAPTVTAVCQHSTKVCYGCLRKGIAIQVQEGILGQLKCPSCPENLSYNDIQRYASREVFKRYDYLLSRAAKDMFMCLGPACGAGQVHKGGKEQPMMICNSCEFKICTYHGRPWHEGQTCAQFDADPAQIGRLEEEEATAKLLANDSRICPNCQQGVSKQFGCDHMACRCGKAWCFVCEADWENIIRLGGQAHARHCVYHPEHVRKRPDELNAERNRTLEAVHGGAVSEVLQQARAEHQEKRRATIRPLALEAAEKRMQEMKETQKEDVSTVAKKRKVVLKPAWEEGGIARRPF